jgi:hypothetical protein
MKALICILLAMACFSAFLLLTGAVFTIHDDPMISAVLIMGAIGTLAPSFAVYKRPVIYIYPKGR